MRYKYLVFGAGRIGTAAVYDLLLNCEAAQVVVVDPDQNALNAAQVRLLSLQDDSQFPLYRFDNRLIFVQDVNTVDFSKFNATICCTPYECNLAIMKQSLSSGTPFCDLGGNADMVSQQEEYMKTTKCTTSAAVVDCGIAPGLSNVLVAHLAKKGCDQIKIRCGGIPSKYTSNFLNYKFVFDIDGFISEYSGLVPIIRDGKMETIETLSTIEPIVIDGRNYECSPTSNNSPQTVKGLLDKGVREYDYMTIRHSGHWAKMRGYKAVGYFCGDREKDRTLINKWMEDDKSLKYDPTNDQDRLVLLVSGSKSVGNGRLRKNYGYTLDVTADPKTKFSAMELTTSWGITIVAYALAKDMALKGGFCTPESAFYLQSIIKELEKRLRREDA